MSTDPSALAALIGSRICHDLISPIGAINNGLELLAMSGAPEGPEMELIGESVGNASARIRFFRMAFGAAGEQMVGAPEVSSILNDLYQSSRLEVVWAIEDPQPRACVRLAFLALLCLESGMPYGGQITVRAADGQWQITGTADKVNIDEALWGHLAKSGAAGDLQPSQVQFALLPTLAAQDGRRIVSQTDAERVEISF